MRSVPDPNTTSVNVKNTYNITNITCSLTSAAVQGRVNKLFYNI